MAGDRMNEAACSRRASYDIPASRWFPNAMSDFILDENLDLSNFLRPNAGSASAPFETPTLWAPQDEVFYNFIIDLSSS
jgi:hypothetical protein